jgi:hypothetical protein
MMSSPGARFRDGGAAPPPFHSLCLTHNPLVTVRPYGIVGPVLETITDAIRAEIEHATNTVATATARAARGGALIGGALGGILAVVLLALGIIIGKVT